LQPNREGISLLRLIRANLPRLKAICAGPSFAFRMTEVAMISTPRPSWLRSSNVQVGYREGSLCKTLLLFSIALKTIEFSEVVELYGDGDWERFRVLLRDHHTPSAALMLSRFDGRWVQNSLPNFNKRRSDLHRSPISKSANREAATISFRNLVGGWKLVVGHHSLLGSPRSDHTFGQTITPAIMLVQSDAATTRLLEGEDPGYRRNGYCRTDKVALFFRGSP